MLAVYYVFKQKYQKGFIHRKLRVRTSEREGKLSNPRGHAARARCMEKIYGNSRSCAAREPCIDFAAAKNTVVRSLKVSKVPVVDHNRSYLRKANLVQF
jgi:hypothetical protein